MKKAIGSLALSAFLLSPVTILRAQDDHHDRDHEQHEQVKHEWNDGENPTWHQYLKEHHKRDHDWDKANKREQASYWKWRDQHRDNH